MNDHSCVLIVPAEYHADLEVVFCAWGKSELPGYSFTAQLSSDGTAPPTHYAGHEMKSNAEAMEYAALGTDDGVLPAALSDVDWDQWGITLARAKAAAKSVKAGIMVNVPGITNFASMKAELGLVDVAEDTGAV